MAAAWTLLAAERVSRSLTVGVIAAAFSVAIFPRAYAYPKVLLLSAGLLVMWAWLRTPSRGRMAWLACVVAVASLFRHDYGAYLGAAGLATVLLAPADGWRHACTRALMFCGLVAVLLAPYAVYLQASVGIQSAVRKVIEYGVWHAKRTHLDIGELGWGHEVRLYYAFHALPFVALACLAGDRLRRRATDTAVIVPLALLAVVVNVGFLRDPLSYRLADAVVPAVVIAAWLAGRALHVRGMRARVAAVTAVVILTALGADSVVTVARTSEELNRTGLRRGTFTRVPEFLYGRTQELRARFPRDQVPDGRVLSLVPFLQYVDRCTTTEHRLLVAGYNPEIYVYARRMFAGGQKVFIQGYYTAPIDQQIAINRMQRTDVAFVLFFSGDAAHDWREWFFLISAFVDAHFRPMTNIPVPGDRTVDVWVNTAFRPLRTDVQTGWPCFQ